jgi:hypothetical protein
MCALKSNDTGKRVPDPLFPAVEAMGEVHPLFERGGMRRAPPVKEGEAAYFIFDRGEGGRDAK